MTADDDLADAVAERALGRATAAAAFGGLALGVLALLFLTLEDGGVDARSLPQLLVLGVGQVAGLVAAAASASRLRTVRAVPGTGPGHAAGAAALLGRLVVVTSATGLGVAAVGTALVRPVATGAFSAVVALALLSQLVLILHWQRRRLLRAAVRR